MDNFIDKNGATVTLSFNKNQFTHQPTDVIVFCQYGDQWLLTNHKKRGWEFPGGKKDQGETILQAAKREVFEETGALITKLKFVGEYKVTMQNKGFVKAIYYAEIDKLISKTNYLETKGPVLVPKNRLMEDRFQDHYSFIMKDDLVRLVIEKLTL